MYICRIVSTVDVNECTFCVNEQQKVYSLSPRLSLSYHFLFFKASINYPTGFPPVCLSEKSEPKHSRKQNKTEQQQETAMTKSNRNKKDKKEWNNFSVLFLKEDVLLTQIH